MTSSTPYRQNAVHCEVSPPPPDAAVDPEGGVLAGVAITVAPVTRARNRRRPGLCAGDVVNPGFGGQTFIPRSESKVRVIRELLDRAVSGRRLRSTAASTSRTPRASSPPAEILVAGQAIFGQGDAEQATRDSSRGALRERAS